MRGIGSGAGPSGGIAALAVLAFVLVNDAARNALARWVMPWRNVERFTFARVQPLPERLVVPYAEPFSLPVRLTGGTRWSPGEGTGRIGKQPAVTATLSSRRVSASFSAAKAGRPARGVAGRRAEVDQLQPRTRPELADLAVRLRLPAYLGYKSEPRIEVHGGSVSVVKGARPAFEAKASRELAAAEMDGASAAGGWKEIHDGIPAGRGRRRAEIHLEGSRRAHAARSAGAEGARGGGRSRRRSWRGAKSMEEVVLDSEVVTFDVNARRRFRHQARGAGVGRLAEQDDGKTPIHGEKVAAAGEHEKRELAARATFCATREGVAPQTLEVRAWAEDYLPGPAALALGVVHPARAEQDGPRALADRAIWQMAGGRAGELRARAAASSDEQGTARADAPAELDRPENRRRVSQQAAAENANAARLDSLTQSGRNLVEQATKNDEFDAKRLESWATMLKTLKDIAANRMPSVSDLAEADRRAPPAESLPRASPTGGAAASSSSSRRNPARRRTRRRRRARRA